MYGWIQGLSDADEIRFCPWCGEEIYGRFADGTASCRECGHRFGVIDRTEEEEEP